MDLKIVGECFDAYDIHNYQRKNGAKIRYKVVFDENGGRHDLSTIFEEKHEIVLSKDGTLKKDISSDMILWLYSKEDAIKVEAQLDSFMEKICNENGYLYPEYSSYTHIELDKCGNPKHLFTKKELIKVLEDADDRHSNTVVIDEDGEVHIVEENEHLYPVINETFQAGNIYVGKYADVMGVANDLYPSLLGAWIDYLKYGKRYYIEYYEYSGKDVDQLENEVKEIMKKL